MPSEWIQVAKPQLQCNPLPLQALPLTLIVPRSLATIPIPRTAVSTMSVSLAVPFWRAALVDSCTATNCRHVTGREMWDVMQWYLRSANNISNTNRPGCKMHSPLGQLLLNSQSTPVLSSRSRFSTNNLNSSSTNSNSPSKLNSSPELGSRLSPVQWLHQHLSAHAAHPNNNNTNISSHNNTSSSNSLPSDSLHHRPSWEWLPIL